MNGNGDRSDGRLELVAPAKINLALLVGPLRPDGFHEIASVMVPITLADRVVVERRRGAGLDVVCDIAPGEANLAARSVRELEARLERGFDVRVTIDKRIPHGGGLGGGSSDAAATLLGVIRLFGLDVSPKLLYEIAFVVGSDVPFFLWPGPQLAMGRGQVLKALELPPLDLVVAVPELALSTARVYGWRDEDIEVSRDDFVPRARRLSTAVQPVLKVSAVAGIVSNDLQPSVERRRPEVAELRRRLLEAGALAAAMTGSGAAVFGLFESSEAADAARVALAPARAWHVSDLQPSELRRPQPE